MKRSFFVNLLLLIAINLIIKPIYIFGIDRNVQNLVGEHNYGLYFTFFTLCMIFMVIGDAGLQNYNSTQVASGKVQYASFFPNILVARLLTSFLFIVIIMSLSLFGIYNKEDMSLLYLVMAGQIMSSFLLLIRTNISGHGYFKVDSIFSSLDRLFLIFLCGFFMWNETLRSSFTIYKFASLQLISYLIVIVICVVWMAIVLPKLDFSLSNINIKKILKSSLPYALVIFLMIIYSRSDIIILERMLPDGAKQAGIYAASFRILDALNMIGYLAGTLLLPMFSKISNDKKQLEELYMLSLKLLSVFTSLFSIVVIFYRHEIMHMLYNNADEVWGNVLGILMFSFIGITLSYISGCHLTANGHLRSMIRSFSIAIAFNIVLNLLVIPHFKVIGVAIVAAITQIFILIIQTKWSMKLSGLHINRTNWIRFLSFISLFIVICMVFKKILPLLWYYKAGITSIFGLLISGMVGFFSFEKIPDPIKRFFIKAR
ncbi:MAG TPA: oligosaccharide flippase family protein [Saprospiraceae bacterium]|nr:oligosaccharide flippase family protein [Saprospiraceae bacterium]